MDKIMNIEVTGFSKEELKTVIKDMIAKGYSFHNFIPQVDNGIAKTIAMLLRK